MIAVSITNEGDPNFNLVAAGRKALTPGKTFIGLSNTAATPIPGTLGNLSDGGTITEGSSDFQTSYSGGDGNDLTLTITP